MAIFKTTNKKGKYRDKDAKECVLNYIENEAKVIHGYTGSKGFMTDNYVEEMKKTCQMYNKEKGVQLRQFVVSFDEDEVKKPETAHQIGTEICDYLGNEFQCVFGVHENTDQLHLHILMNSVSYLDGHRYYGTRKEFYDFKNNLNRVLDKHDIDPARYISNKNG